MIKIIGVVILSISSIVVGLSFYEKYKRRPDSLLMFIDLINNYQLRLKMERKSFSDILFMIDKSDEYIVECKKQARNNLSLGCAMITENSHFEELMLSNDDKTILLNFFNKTGSGSFNDEVTLCTDSLNALNLQLTNSKDIFNKTGVFSIKFALAIALWIAIILL